MREKENGAAVVKMLTRAIGFESHSVAESALKLASRLSLEGQPPRVSLRRERLPFETHYMDSNCSTYSGFGAGEGI